MDQEVNCPLVFQCKGCRSIIGDSFSWVTALEDLDVIVLSGDPSPLALCRPCSSVVPSSWASERANKPCLVHGSTLL